MLAIVACVDRPDVPGLTTRALDDVVVVFFPEEVAETVTYSWHFCCCFYSFLFFSLLNVQYTYSGFVTKLTSPAVTRIGVSSGRRKSLI